MLSPNVYKLIPVSFLNPQTWFCLLYSLFSKLALFHILESNYTEGGYQEVSLCYIGSCSYLQTFSHRGIICGCWTFSHEYRGAASLGLWKWTDGNGYFYSPHWLYRSDLSAPEEESKADRKVFNGGSAGRGLLWQSKRDAGLRDTLSQGCQDTEEEKAEEDS